MNDISTSGRYDTATAYVRKGWAVIPLHHVLPDGSCSCRFAATDPDHQAGGKSVGKHPISKGWQSGPPLSLADAFAVWGEEHPQANIGLRTGTISGFFVLDVDPDNGGRESLARMMEANGPTMPCTYTVRTGSGGVHYYFRLPAFRITNGANRLLVKEYGPGLDIRGEGGQVVAAGSVSGKGAYTVIDDSEIAPAPGWLLELLQATVDTMPAMDSPVVEDLPAVADLSARDADRVQRYAERVMAQEIVEYVEAPPGSGNAALFSAACNMLEIAQSPWNTITTNEVWTRLERARVQRREVHSFGGGQDPQEFAATWESARARVIGQGRALPPDPHAGIAFDPSLFLPEGAAPAETPPPATRDEAMSLVDAMIAKLMTASELAALAPPTPLVHGLINLDSGTWLIGAPGSFKSFVALDIAGHVGTGRPWQGRKVHQGLVLYIAAEGSSGMTLRARAWEKINGPMDGVMFLPLPIRFKDAVAWTTLEAVVTRLKPVLVVIDTQARVTAGMNENDNGEMGEFAAAVTRMQAAAEGACVLVVHHTGRSGGDARGASAIDGAQDTELKVERIEPRSDLKLRLVQDKQKDRADGGPGIELQMRVVELGTHPETGEMLDSLIVGEHDPFSAHVPTGEELEPWKGQAPGEWTKRLVHYNAKIQRRILQVLADHAREHGLTESQVRKIVEDRWEKPSPSNWLDAWTAVLALELVVNGSTGERWTVDAMAVRALQEGAPEAG